MSRKREAARQARINNRKAAGTYTEPIQEGYWKPSEWERNVQAHVESAHDNSKGKPSLVKINSQGVAILYTGAKGAGKEISRAPYFKHQSDHSVSQAHLCRAAIENGYHIVSREWLG